MYFINFSLSENIMVLVHMAMNTYIQYLIRVLHHLKKINAESLSFHPPRACMLSAHTELYFSAKGAESGNYGCVRNFGAPWSSRCTASFDKNAECLPTSSFSGTRAGWSARVEHWTSWQGFPSNLGVSVIQPHLMSWKRLGTTLIKLTDSLKYLDFHKLLFFCWNC